MRACAELAPDPFFVCPFRAAFALTKGGLALPVLLACARARPSASHLTCATPQAAAESIVRGQFFDSMAEGGGLGDSRGTGGRMVPGVAGGGVGPGEFDAGKVPAAKDRPADDAPQEGGLGQAGVRRWGDGGEEGRSLKVEEEGQGGEAVGEDREGWTTTRVSFRVLVGSPLSPGEALYVCGNVAELGGWRPQVCV